MDGAAPALVGFEVKPRVLRLGCDLLHSLHRGLGAQAQQRVPLVGREDKFQGAEDDVHGSAPAPSAHAASW